MNTVSGNINNTERDFVPSNAPILLLVLGLVAIAMAISVSPNLLIKLGPMRVSLLSDLGSVKSIAEFEVLAGRVALGLIGALSLAIWAFWDSWKQSRVVGYLSAYQPMKLLPCHILNSSFLIVAGGVVTTLIWIFLSGRNPALMPSIFVQEDGVIEYTTAFIFLFASGWAAHLALKVPELKRKIVFGLLAVGFFVSFGEEISWGQRILGFSTPDIVQNVNVQDEFNLHNSLGYAADHIFILGVIFFGSILPLLAYRLRFFHHLCDWAGLPIASLGLAVAWLIVSAIHTWTVYKIMPQTQLRIPEVRELLSSLGFLMLMFEANKSLLGSRRSTQ